MTKKRINLVDPNQGAKVKAQDAPNYDDYMPIFSLERVQPGEYCFSALDKNHKAKFSEAIFRRKSTKWSEIKKADRHGIGTEKIPKSAIRAPIPNFITDDVNDFLVFRYHGRNPMVGYRQHNVFFVLWFDHDFTLYDHG